MYFVLLAAAICSLLGAVAQAATPPPASASFQPLVQGASWNYQCTGGVAARRTMTTGSINNTIFGFINMLTLTIPGAVQVQFGELQRNDPAQGTLLAGFVFAPTFPSVAINPPQLELSANPVFGQTTTLPDGYGGTISVTYQGFQTMSVPAGIYTAFVFKETDSGQPPLPFPRTLYMVRGLGEIQTDMAAVPSQNLPATTCQLVNYNLP